MLSNPLQIQTFSDIFRKYGVLPDRLIIFAEIKQMQ